MGMAAAALKRVLLGRPMSSSELEHTLLPKVIALPVFASDPLSSNAYATQEILIVLGMAGTMALSKVLPISIAVALLLATVVTSYRQTVKAYPTGGGAYRVARENLGMYAGLTAAAALLIDYVMTVAVSVTAGADAVVSAAPGLREAKVELVIVFVLFVTVMNLRGVKESGTLFAIPTYGFVISIYLMLITGFVKCLGGCPQAESADIILKPQVALTFFLLLKAFSAGTTALTGVEAIADGVQAFRYPQSKNAAQTLTIMGALSITMFLGISWLADHTNVVFVEDSHRTVVAQIGHTIFGGGPMFYVLQVMTASILILAANTAFQDFPRLSSILAQDRFLPRQFRNRGDRLVFSNGVLILATLAIALVIIFDAELNRLIQLYLVGVFISFTLSQSGMVLRWRKLREPGWRRKAMVNGFGATVTGVVLCVTIATKFKGGAWIIIAAIPVFMFLMRSVYVHYAEVRRELAHPERLPEGRRPGNQNMVIYVRQTDAAAARAVGYARMVRAATMEAITFDRTHAATWNRIAPEIPLKVLEYGRSRTSAIQEYLRGRREGLSDDDFLTLIVPEVLRSRSLWELVRGFRVHRMKAVLRRQTGIQLLDVPVIAEDIEPGVDQAHEPGRNYVCVLVAGVHNAALQAIEYAQTLRPTDLRAVHLSLDPHESEEVGEEWLNAGVPLPLEIEDSPFRDIGLTLLNYVRREFDPDGINRVVTIVLPEFIVKKRRHEILHNQTALLVVKRRLLFEKGVVVVSVPFHL
jgi:amino acid transporter